MQELIDRYIKDHKFAWASSTLASERSRLAKVAPLLSTSEDPQVIYNSVRCKLKPYAVQTLYTRLTHFYGWLLDEGLRTGPNVFARWRRKNRLLFQGAYKREKLDVTFDEAKIRIAGIQDEDTRNTAFSLLHTGMRIHELAKVSGNTVVGKGGKERKVYGEVPEVRVSQSRLRTALKTVGLKPHSLRKLFATRLARNGARPEDLCEVMGWSSIKTAYWYLQPRKEAELKQLVEGI